MEVRKDVVSNLRATIEVSGSDTSTSTRHVTSFRLGNRSVLMRTSDPVPISEGDSIVVAGPVRGGGLIEVLAYRNESNGFSSDEGPFLHLLAGTLGLAVGIVGVIWMMVIAVQQQQHPNVIATVVLGAVAIGGLLALVRGILIRQAITLLQMQAA